MKATVLGARSYVDPSHSESIGILIESSEAAVLIECGPYGVKQLADCAIGLDTLTAVFISHDHPDHAAGLPWLLFSNLMERFHGRIGPGSLDLLVPDGDGLAIVDYCRRVYPNLFAGGGAFEIRCVEVPRDGASVPHRGLSLSCLTIDHAVPNVALRIEEDGVAVVYVSDTLAVPELVPFAMDADLLVCSSAGSRSRAGGPATSFKFLTAAEAGQLARDAHARRLWLVHAFFEDDVDASLEEASGVFGAQAVMAARGDRALL